MKNTLILILAMLLCCFITTVAMADPPANDSCANAYDLGTLVSGSTSQNSGIFTDATQDCDDSNDDEVWVKFTIASCMDVTIDFCDDEYRESACHYLYGVCPCDDETYRTDTDYCESNYNPIYTWLNLEAGTYYYPIWSDGYDEYVVNVTGVDCPTTPDNDDCANAEAIGEVSDMAYSTRAASFDGEGACMSSPNVWYVYTPTFTGNARISFDADYNHQLAVYDDYSCSPLPTRLGCTENSQLDFAVVTGQQYLIEIGGSEGDIGDGSFTIAEAPEPPANDDCADATDVGTLVADYTVQLSGNLTDATRDCEYNEIAEVWVKFTVASCMDVTIDYCDDSGSYMDPSAYLFGECPCNDLVNMTSRGYCSNYNQSFTWAGLEAGTYYYPIWSWMGNASYVVNITGTDCPPPPDNDDCANAIEVGEVEDYAFTTISSTYDGSGSCITSGGNIWFIYTPSFTGSARLDLDDSDFNTEAAIYDGIDCSTLPFEITCSEESKIDFLVVSGQQYLIEIGGYNNETGDGLLTISETPPPPENDECEYATNAGTLEDSVSVQLTGNNEEATNDCEIVYYPEVWIKFTLTECMDVTLDYCGTEPTAGESISFMLFDSCPCGDYIYFDGILFYCPDENIGLTWSVLPAGTYYYPVISNDDWFSGSYTINIIGTTCPPPPDNDDCENATDAGTLTAGETMELTGTNLGATSDCENISSSEVWIKFTLPENMHVTVDLCGSDVYFNSVYDGLFNDCPCGEAIWSDNSSRSSCEDNNPTLSWYDLSAGTYWFPILKNSEMQGNYVAHVTGYEILPLPEPIAITAPDTATGTTCGALNNCYLLPGEDVTYEVTIPSDGDWVFSLCSSGTLWDSYLTLGTELCESDIDDNDDDCGESEGHAEITAQVLSAGTYYLTVDSYTGTCGDYTLEIYPLPGPCEGSYYANGDTDLENGIPTCRDYEGSYDFLAADDFTLTEEVSINSLIFTCASNEYSDFLYQGDYQILANDGVDGAPGTILFEGTGISCSRTNTRSYYQDEMNVYTFQLDNLAITLSSGTYYLAFRPVFYFYYASGSPYWLTTDSQSGSTAYYKEGSGDWTLSDVNADLAFCLFATISGGDIYYYLPGDANMVGGGWKPSARSNDVTYLVNYFRGSGEACFLDEFYASADANGNCRVQSSDVTYLVNYFRGGPELRYCSDYEPAWLSSDDAPEEKPDGWPYCD